MKLIAMHNGHDASITAMEDGEVLYHWELERILNIKHFCGLDAPNYIFEVLEAHCLPRLGWSLDDIDTFVLGGQTEWEKSKFSSIVPYTPEYPVYENDYDRPYADFQATWEGKERRFILVTHHVSHMAYAYYTGPHAEAMLLAYDGVGDFNTTTTIGYGEAGKIKYLANMSREDFFPNNSIGLTYSHLGFLFKFFYTPHLLSTAGKAMGLSSYGTPYPQDHEVWQAAWKLITSYPQNENLSGFYNTINKYIEPDELSDPMNENVQNIMATIQDAAEIYVCRLVEESRAEFKIPVRKLCMAGGCALNVQINTRLIDDGVVDDLYVPPATSDCGISYGALLYAWYHVMDNEWAPVEWHDPYMGDEVCYQLHDRDDPEFDEDVATFLKEWPTLEAHYIDDTNTLVWLAANWLAEGKIVAWAHGRAEIGPRALGNRSILCHPGVAGKGTAISYKKWPNGGVMTIGTMKDTINEKVKHREFWRPFAPIVLEEYAHHIFEIDHPQPYMLESPMVREWRWFQEDESYWWADIAAVVHVDGTCRVQTVNARQNYLLYTLLEKFRRITGLPVILNTSLNDKGVPIANTTPHILHLLNGSELDYAVIGNWVFSKRK